MFKAAVVHIGANPDSSMKAVCDHFLRIPVTSKLCLPDEIVSQQPMASLFEQSLLLLGGHYCPDDGGRAAAGYSHVLALFDSARMMIGEQQ
ncbi:hypothetical protein [Citrobacter amalonaticus]|uniref:hypothetical protein n=1 Tax=Citrobacter amalonaticus TaxID=35703 RepID=UPI0021560BBC|nr:hypothetical protein [Citrobacter amalonaticus]